MKKKTIQFPKVEYKIFKGFGPAFLAIALAIGSGELILWPYLTIHHGFGILWGALLGIALQLIMIIALERQTAFLGENAVKNFSRIFQYAYPWILFSTIIGFAWPGFSAMSAKIISQAFDIPISQKFLSIIILLSAFLIVGIGKKVYLRILRFQEINMTILFILISFLFLYALILSPKSFIELIFGFFGKGNTYLFFPKALSLSVFLGAIAYAGSGGNLLLMNSFYVEKEKKGLVPFKKRNENIEPSEEKNSLFETKKFTKFSTLQNGIFFFGFGILLIVMLSFISYVFFNEITEIPHVSNDFSFLITEGLIFSKKIHPIIGKLFFLTTALAFFGVQLGILDFIGRLSAIHLDSESEKRKRYQKAVSITVLLGLFVLGIGLSQPKQLIVTGSVLNAGAMGIIALLLYKVEKKLIPQKIQSTFLKKILIPIFLFYTLFFFVVVGKYLFY